MNRTPSDKRLSVEMLPRWLIKFGFYLLYHHMAWAYEWIAWLVSFGQWAAWRRLALLFMQPGPTLELAYGTGLFFVDLLEAGFKPVGIDLSPYMARLAGNQLCQRSLNLPLSLAKAQALPFPTNSFINVVATFPTDYILEDETLSEIYRVLQGPTLSKNGLTGRLIVVAEGKLRGPWPICSFVDWLYQITDQRSIPPAKPLNLLTASRFKARWETAEYQGARARLLIAIKEE